MEFFNRGRLTTAQTKIFLAVLSSPRPVSQIKIGRRIYIVNSNRDRIIITPRRHLEIRPLLLVFDTYTTKGITQENHLQNLKEKKER